jgi:DNA-binding NarL/FixJ family response regulator
MSTSATRVVLADDEVLMREGLATIAGLEAAEAIREEFPDTALLVLSAHVQVERATALLASGERSGFAASG